MKKEGKKKENKKITPFPERPDFNAELEDAKMDRFLRKNIMEEADRIERELEEDPKLSGIKVPGDLYGKIVAELKAKGSWESEEEEKAEAKRTEEVQPIEANICREDKNKTNILQDESVEKSVKEAAYFEKTTTPAELKNLKQNAEQQSCSNAEKTPLEEVQKKDSVYAMLSDADREALAFGYEMKKKEQARKEKRKHRNRRLKYVSAAMVALVFVGGIGVSTEASRKWILQIRDVVLGNFGVGIKHNFVDDIGKTRVIEEDEEQAMLDIRQKLQIGTIRFMYLPLDIQFVSYEIDENSLTAVMFYSYKDTLFTVHLLGNTNENMFYCWPDRNMELKEVIKTEQDIEIELYEVQEEKKITYMANFSYEDNCYYCNGAIPLSEMQKILKYLIISDE